jgi:hypothetical protein
LGWGLGNDAYGDAPAQHGISKARALESQYIDFPTNNAGYDGILAVKWAEMTKIQRKKHTEGGICAKKVCITKSESPLPATTGMLSARPVATINMEGTGVDGDSALGAKMDVNAR